MFTPSRYKKDKITKATKKASRPRRIWTRSRIRNMEGVVDDLEDRHEKLSEEVSQMGGKVDTIMEALKMIQVKLGISGNSADGPVAAPDHPPGFTSMHQADLNAQYPYGMPLGFASFGATNAAGNNLRATCTNGQPRPEVQPSQSQGNNDNSHNVTPDPLNPMPVQNQSTGVYTTQAAPPQPTTIHFTQDHPVNPNATEAQHHYQSPNIIPDTTPRSHQFENPNPKDKLQFLEERVRAIEGFDNYDFNAADLCLVSNVIIPPKFKIPDFEKYGGITCPKNHLTMYCRKMAAYAHDDKLLVHFFQESLVGAALQWYTNLERRRVHTWKDLADAFLKQYKYNMDMAPDRMQLQNMSKKEKESFKEYAQRWRVIATQVQPPLTEREMVTMFIDTLQSPFYDRMIGNVSSNFSDLVVIGERVEAGMRTGKIPGVRSANSRRFPDSKRAETNAVMTAPSFGQHPSVSNRQFQRAQGHQVAAVSQPVYQQPYQPIHQQPYQPKTAYPPPTLPQAIPYHRPPRVADTNERKNLVQQRVFTPIPMTYTELLPRLVHSALVTPVPLRPVEPPFPRGYDPRAKCDYHAGAVGHATERCWGLKHKVQDLLEAGMLKFEEIDPNVKGNPLPEHREPSVNVVDDYHNLKPAGKEGGQE